MKAKLCFIIILLLLSVFPLRVYSQSLDQGYIDYYNPLLNGATCDSTTLQAAITTIGLQQKTVYLTATDRNKVACVWTITSPIVVPENITLWVPKGVTGLITGLGSLTVDGCLRADDIAWVAVPVPHGICPEAPLLLASDDPLTASGPRRIVTDATVATNLTTDSSAVWVWEAPGPIVTVAPGTLLVLGACPVAGRWKIFEALENASSGSIRFHPGACGHFHPEWLGADGTGTLVSTEAWRVTMNVVSGNAVTDEPYQRIPIACDGSYSIDAALTVKPRLAIYGHYKTSTSGTKTVSCEFLYTGTGHLFHGPDIGMSYSDLDFRHIRIRDVNDTGDRAFFIVLPSGLTMENVFVQGFNAPWFWQGQLTYGSLKGLVARFYRERCMEITATANFSNIEVTCGATLGNTVTHGVRVGLETGLFGVSTNLKIRAIVEASSGLPISISRVRGINAELYVEQTGLCADYSTNGAINLSRIDGGRVHLTTTGNCSGGPPAISRGVWLSHNAGTTGTNNVALTGWINNNYTLPLIIDAGAGVWGNDITNLQFPVVPSIIGDFTTGVMVGGGYWTHGSAPSVDMGMSSTLDGTHWTVGSMIWSQGGANFAANLFWQVTNNVNPPTFARIIMPTTTRIVVAAGTTTPDIKVGNTYHTMMALEAGSNITNLLNAIGGICVDINATGARTVVHGTPIRLSTSVNYVMASGNTLRLCADDSTGPWREYSRCATCVP